MTELQAKIADYIRSYCKSYRTQRQYQDSRTFLPYCIVQTEKGWLVLNRNYKPIGISTEDRVDYNAPEFDHLRLTYEQFDSAGAFAAVRDAFFLFDGSCPPYAGNIKWRRAYINRAIKCFRLQGAIK